MLPTRFLNLQPFPKLPYLPHLPRLIYFPDHSCYINLGATISPIPNYVVTFLVANFASAYLVLSARTIKQWYGLDHNASPGEDVSKYGARIVKDGKITQATLDMIKRWEFAHTSAMENYTFFAMAVLLALNTGVLTGIMNGLMLEYTVARAAYADSYVRTADDLKSQIRGICWWSGNICCLVMMGLAGERLQV